MSINFSPPTIELHRKKQFLPVDDVVPLPSSIDDITQARHLCDSINQTLHGLNQDLNPICTVASTLQKYLVQVGGKTLCRARAD